MMPVLLSVCCFLLYVLRVPEPIDRGLVFPMALVPNIFGVWNMIYQRVRSGPGARHNRD